MATGTIDAQEIGNGTGPVTLTKQSAAKAWAVYAESVNTVSASFNITSVSDDGVGAATFTLTSSMSSADYTCNGAWRSRGFVRIGSTTRTSSAVDVLTENSGGSPSEAIYKAMDVHGDLAT